MRVTPFTIAVDDEALRDLDQRLRRTRWPDPSPEPEWTEGTDLAFLQRLVQHWTDRFDWPAQVAALNALPQFEAEIDGLSVHFLHVRGIGPDPYPLLLGHGWPGTAFDLRRLIPLLTDPGAHGADPADAFTVVAPSIAGYGFSERPDRPGFGPERVAGTWAQLMAGLGYDRYGVHSSDWGAAVAIWMAAQVPDRVSGLHLDFLPGLFQPGTGDGDRPLSDAEQRFVRDQQTWFAENGAYHRLHSTRPQTPAYALTDSPAGLAAWIVEKMRAWSDQRQPFEEVFTLDDVLTNISLFWFTETIGSSMRFYHENALRPNIFRAGDRITPPLSFSAFPWSGDPVPPREWLERVFDVQRYAVMPTGGHFADWEAPEQLAVEIREFFRPLRRAR